MAEEKTAPLPVSKAEAGLLLELLSKAAVPVSHGILAGNLLARITAAHKSLSAPPDQV